MLNDPFPWMKKNITQGSGSPVILASWGRIFRNLKDVPFLVRSAPQEQEAFAEMVGAALEQTGLFSGQEKLTFPLTPNRSVCLQESCLVTPAFARGRFRGQMVYQSPDHALSVLVNGEDHLTSGVFARGLALKKIYEQLNEWDDCISGKLAFAFHPKFGYLSPDPANSGTGFECSALLHLPGIALTDGIKTMIAACTRLGLKCCGIFDSPNKFPGNLYRISNLSKMGETEMQIVNRMEKTLLNIAAEEQYVREKLLRSERMKAEDFCYRSLAVLKYARMITSVEALNALSGLKLAQEYGLCADLLPADLPGWDELLLMVMPGHVAAHLAAPESGTAAQRAVCRAEILRNKLGAQNS